MIQTPSRSGNSATLGIIGAGRWGKNLVKNANALGCLKAVAEASEPLRAGLSEEFPDVKIHSSFDPLLMDPEIRGVLIATPVPTHYEIAKQALEADKDVFV